MKNKGSKLRINFFLGFISILIISSFVNTPIISAQQKDEDNFGKHLFILSGQSNMARLNHEISFVPAIEAEFGKENVIFVKNAKGGQPIRRWYKNWKAPDGLVPESSGDLYDLLMEDVRKAIEGEEIGTITFIWMQGEADAKSSLGEVYAVSLQGLIGQLSDDLGRDDLNVVIGRISDFDMSNNKYPHWTIVREAQEEVSNSNERYVWVDTDDLNDGMNMKGEQVRNDLHCIPDGYKILGQRFAKASIKLICNKD